MASFNVVSTALVAEEKPTCCRFFEKYSAVLLVVIFLDEERLRDMTFFASASSSLAAFALFLGADFVAFLPLVLLRVLAFLVLVRFAIFSGQLSVRAIL